MDETIIQPRVKMTYLQQPGWKKLEKGSTLFMTNSAMMISGEANNGVPCNYDGINWENQDETPTIDISDQSQRMQLAHGDHRKTLVGQHHAGVLKFTKLRLGEI